MIYFCLGIVVVVGLTVVTALDAGAAADENPVVVLDTTMGPIIIELDKAKAPGTVANFLRYVDDKFYDGLIFHRVMGDFMIQGGGFDPKMNEKATRAPIRNEAANALSNRRGTIAMARTNDPDSATSQFFINLFDSNSRLDARAGSAGYCAFGKVTAGMDVVDKISQVKTGSMRDARGMFHDDVPVEPVVIRSARRKAKS